MLEINNATATGNPTHKDNEKCVGDGLAALGQSLIGLSFCIHLSTTMLILKGNEQDVGVKATSHCKWSG